MKVWLLLLALAAPAPALRAQALATPLLDSYTQVLRIQAAPGVDPAGLSLQMAPLLGDAQWAFTQRWDDNLVDSLRVRDLLRRRRMHGSFYLNATDNWYGNETRYPFTGDPAKDLAKELLKGGNSIGAHTLSHNFVPALARPEIFYETLANRIDREVNSQSPINSFVFPFTLFRNDLEGSGVHKDIAELLLRAGFLHVANQYFNARLPEPTPLLDSWLLPCDGQDADPAIRSLLQSVKQQEREPVICVCMHAWPAQWGGKALPKLDKLLRRWRGRKTWWYANANELAAYRWQALHGPLSAQLRGDGVDLALQRFEPWDLGDDVPATLVVSGAGPLTPSAQLGGQALVVKKGRRKGTWLVEVPQSPGHELPAFYDWHRNPSNKAEGLDGKGKGHLPGLASRLWLDGGGLHLRLQDDGPALTELRVSWRLPLGWTVPDPERRPLLKHGETLDLSLAPALDEDPLFTQGRFYAAVQIDALQGGQRIRLYSDVHAAAAPRDPSFPNGGFKVLGPLPGDRKDFDRDLFVSRQFHRKALRPCEALNQDLQSCWESPPQARREVLHPEIIPAGGMQAPRTFYTWDPTLFYPHGHKLAYLLAADVYSPSDRTVKAFYPRGPVKRLQVNGKRVGRSRRFKLHEGLNRLLISYSAGSADADGQGSFSILNYGPFFRLVDGEGKRLTDIRYEEPKELVADAAPTPNPAVASATTPGVAKKP